jgi:ferredoxin-NADP reductase
VARIFRRVVVVTTGSGIGPFLAVIQDVPQRGTKCRVIWSTPYPLATYGWEICQAVHAVDEHAAVVDTRKEGRPDLVKRAWDLYHQTGAEAVFVITGRLSNKSVSQL